MFRDINKDRCQCGVTSAEKAVNEPIIAAPETDAVPNVREASVGVAPSAGSPATVHSTSADDCPTCAEEEARSLLHEIANLRARCERLERRLAEVEELHLMQLAGISTATFQNTKTSIKDRIGPDNPYYTVAYGDVCRAIDREMEWRAKADQLQTAVREWVKAGRPLAKRVGGRESHSPAWPDEGQATGVTWGNLRTLAAAYTKHAALAGERKD